MTVIICRAASSSCMFYFPSAPRWLSVVLQPPFSIHLVSVSHANKSFHPNVRPLSPITAVSPTPRPSPASGCARSALVAPRCLLDELVICKVTNELWSLLPHRGPHSWKWSCVLLRPSSLLFIVACDCLGGCWVWWAGGLMFVFPGSDSPLVVWCVSI